MAQRGYGPRMGMRAGRGLLALVLGALLTVSLGGVGVIAAPPTPADPAGSHGEVLGLVPPKNQANRRPASANNLTYHGGPVMHANTVYAIYWVPTGYSVSAQYRSTIDGFFANVAAASATATPTTSNVYYADTQYSDGSGPIANRSTFASATNSVVDTNVFPSNGCTDSYTSICVSDAQIRSELAKVMAAQGWTGGPDKLYFMFTPQGVGSCTGASSCAFSQYCAYHSSFTPVGASVTTLYANQPYAASFSSCSAGQRPNGDDADDTLNVVSHEHNEAITDPLGSSWYDNQGYENGDKCAWTFGTALGGGSGAQYNQAIGTGKYYLQREWSNKSGACVLTGQ